MDCPHVVCHCPMQRGSHLSPWLTLALDTVATASGVSGRICRDGGTLDVVRLFKHMCVGLCLHVHVCVHVFVRTCTHICACATT